jgi:arylsulfatase A-like enzyme
MGWERWWCGVALGAALGALACGAGAPGGPPSFLLVVLDTTRADAVSAYGAVDGTTPTVDRLARKGLLFEQAWANAGWTLPSHASLFTGLDPSRHGVGWRRTWADDALVTLGERLRDAGWETVAISENPWITDDFNMVQGFEHATHVADARTEVRRWVDERTDERPFFLFVNLLDAHDPYAVREHNRFVPGGATPAEAHAVSRDHVEYFCRAEWSGRDVDVLRGLYLGDVAAADTKLDAILEHLGDAGGAGHLITIVTADHGEAFGEDAIVGHLVGVGDALLRVPLVVHGLPNVSPARIPAPVQLADVTPSVLAWAGMTPAPDLTGRRLPERADERPPERAFVEHWTDPADVVRGSIDPRAPGIPASARARLATLRRVCTRGEDVFGTRTALVAPPWKVVVRGDRPLQLFRTGAILQDARDVAATHPGTAGRLATRLDELRGTPPPGDSEPAVVDTDLRRQLEELGYIDDE